MYAEICLTVDFLEKGEAKEGRTEEKGENEKEQGEKGEVNRGRKRRQDEREEGGSSGKTDGICVCRF